jgi:pyruvate/2-oxoglutarate dehydrogenase complex dihydrolipoamide dehydrogenase (E3) component
VKLTETGYIAVDERLATTAPSVWAMGECAGSPQFTHASFDDFRVVYDNLNGGSSTTTDRLVPFCMYTDPELARVGWTESEARRRGIGYRLLTLPMAAVQTAMIGRVPYTALRSAIYAHPTVAEGLTFLLRNTPTAPAR